VNRTFIPSFGWSIAVAAGVMISLPRVAAAADPDPKAPSGTSKSDAAAPAKSDASAPAKSDSAAPAKADPAAPAKTDPAAPTSSTTDASTSTPSTTAEPSAPAATDSSATAGASASASTDAGLSGEASGLAEEMGDPNAQIETAPGARRCGGRDVHQGDHPEFVDPSCWDGQLGAAGIALHGGLELDLGYADYGFRDLDTTPERQFLDLRGRFVLGAHLHHEFGKSGYFVEAVGQVVGWLREMEDDYQINVDDVFGKVGHTGKPFTNWDFQVGRFMTWRVYHKGLGFDLYTLEECGAQVNPEVCGVHTYEVNYIYMRNAPFPIDHESAGRAAIHYYPHRSVGVELAGVYGQVNSGNDNAVGGRLAVDFHRGFGPTWKDTKLVLIRASAGAEYRASKPALKTATLDPNTGDYNHCTDCNFADNKGVGGGLIAKVGPVEVSGSGARGYDMKHEPNSGANDPEHSARSPEDTAEITSFGGYFEVDPGKLLLKRSLILGIGAHRTERIQETDDYQVHTQGAIYAAFPLGFNDTIIKFVVSRAELDNYQRTSVVGAPLTFRLTQSAMTAGRLRFKYSF